MEKPEIFQNEGKYPEYGEEIIPGDLFSVHQGGEDDQTEEELGDFEIYKSVDGNVSLNDQ